MKESIKHVIWISALVVIAEIYFVGQRNDLFTSTPAPEAPSVDYWKMFANITKERKYIEEVGAHYRIPVFTPDLLELSGKEVTLSGYFLPYSRIDTMIIISRFPNASCFYCGQAGIESVAMVELDEEDPQFFMDQRLTVKGKLALNSTDVNKLAFVLEDATIEEL